MELDSSEKKELAKLREVIKRAPPTIVLVGMSGVGKSSTINTLFKSDLTISHTVACTKEFEKLDLDLIAHNTVQEKIRLVVYDAPGLGEDLEKDPEYVKEYKKYLPKCDVIVWVTAARNRAIALDQKYLEEFKEFSSKIVFGVSQVDLTHPVNWKNNMPIPSKEQEKNISEIVQDRKERFGRILDREINVIPYSNDKGYNLEALFLGIMNSCPKDRAWLFKALKTYDVKNYLSASIEKTSSKSSGGKEKKNRFLSAFSRK